VGYQASLKYLYDLQLFGIKLGLQNVQTLLECLENPHLDYKIAHCAGTNGKGSVCSFLARLLQASGYKVGLYTSPHLHSFTERIRINGEPVSEQEIVELTEEIRPCCSDIQITFFEFTTAMAFLAFARHGVDFVVLEVGMGGRLDATNIVTPEISLITPISDDHGQYLGDSLAAIAAEKGGIIKPSVPVVMGRQDAASFNTLIEIAAEQNAPVQYPGNNYQLTKNGNSYQFQSPDLSLKGIQCPLAGNHQLDNLSQALCAYGYLMRGQKKVDEQVLREAIIGTRWPGRLEWLVKDSVSVLLDGAHNAAGTETLCRYLVEQGLEGIHWIIGIKKGKDSVAMMAQMLPLLTTVSFVDCPVEAPLPAAELLAQLQILGGDGLCFKAVDDALDQAVDSGCKTIVVAGSLFLVAETRQILLNRGYSPC